MQKRAKTEGIGGGIPPDKICHRIFAFSGTLVIFKQRSKHATPTGLYIMGKISLPPWKMVALKIKFQFLFSIRDKLRTWSVHAKLNYEKYLSFQKFIEFCLQA